MQRYDLTNEVEELAFEFFFAFSRFEFALKENRYLVSHLEGAPAQPGWAEFVQRFEAAYVPSAAAHRLLDLAPERQLVAVHGDLRFEREVFSADTSNLKMVTRVLKNVRNNLFHGGKHTPGGWDNPVRICVLLAVCLEVLSDLAQLGGLEADYTGYY